MSPPTATLDYNAPAYDEAAQTRLAEYDAAYGARVMDDLNLSAGGAMRRALLSLATVGLGLILLAATLSYSPFDSTWDTAGLGDTENLLGQAGANVANILMQALGWGSVMLAVLVTTSGLRGIFRPRPALPRGWTRRIALAKCLGIVTAITVFGAATLSAFPIPQSWPLSAGLGGWVGDLVHLAPKGWISAVPLAGLWVALLTFTAFSYGLGRYLGVAGQDLLDVWDAALIAWAHIRVRSAQFAAWVKRHWRARTRGYAREVEDTASIDSLMRTIPDAPAAEPEPAPIAVSAPPPAPAPKPRRKPRKTPAKPAFVFDQGEAFTLPGLDLLKTPPPRSAATDAAALRRQAEQLHGVLADFGVHGEMGDVRPGPVVTLFEFIPAPGVKAQRVINLSDDIARTMAAKSARIAVVPERNAMGIELPNRRRETVWLRDMLASRTFAENDAALPLILGEDIGGQPFITDLAKMPHLLVAGTTGSGKSVGVNAMILSLMYRLPPERCKFIMIDPKMLELSVYDGAPHLLAPVVTNPAKAVVALKWTVREMETRYQKMSDMKVRNMAGYNEKVADILGRGETPTKTVMTGYHPETGEPEYETVELNIEPMPYIVVIIDEMADLMMVAGKDIEGAVQRLAQMARAAGIHVIMATQRPSTDVITGTIKANFPARICFRVGSKIDSRVILGEQGGEQLLGNGDMLFAGTGRPRRLHGPFVSDGEVEHIANYVKAQGSPTYLADITTERSEPDLDADGNPPEANSLFDQAVAVAQRDRKATTSYLQRKLGIGYNKAATLIERMEQEGMIGPSGPGGKREIFLPE